MACEYSAVEINSQAVLIAKRVTDALAATEQLYAFLSGLAVDDLVNSAGGGMTETRATVIKTAVTELHDLAQKFAGTLGMTDSAQTPLDLPHDYRVMAGRLIGPKILS